MKLCPQCESGYHDTNVSCPTHGGVLSEIRELKQGMLIHKTYRIVRKLGQGGMGTVYLADHVLMEESRALKFLSAELSQDVAFTSRFRREVRTLRQVRHKNVVDCGDLEPAEDDSLFFPMEFVDGPDLRSFMRNSPQPFSVPLALSLTHGIAEGLGVAHALGMVHRDIKPENILMARIGDQWVPKIADFGIVATKEMSAYTQAGASLLTPFYAAPEQWRGTRAADLDGRTDLYALGGMLFEMLTGEKVFLAENYEGWMESHRVTPPRPPSSVRPDLANWRGLDDLVVRMLGKNPSDRPRDVAELLGLLSGIQYVPPIASTLSAAPAIPPGLAPTAMYAPPVTPFATVAPVTPATNAGNTPTAASPGFEPVSSQPTQEFPPVQSSPPQVPVAPQVLQAYVPPTMPVARGTTSGKVPGWVWALCLGLVVLVAAGAVFAGRYYAAKFGAKSQEVLPDNSVQTMPSSPAQPTAQPDATQSAANGTSADAAKANAEPVDALKSTAEQPVVNAPVKPGAVGGEKNAANTNPTRKPTVAEMARQGSAFYDEQRYAEAQPLLDKACSGGDAGACKVLGFMYAKPLGVVQDFAKAAQLYTKACDGGNSAACSNLGGLLQSGSGVTKDYARAASLYQKACDAKVANACSNLGLLYQHGYGVSADLVKAKELLNKGCSLGNQAGCDWAQKLP